jgi:hypothetical protein
MLTTAIRTSNSIDINFAWTIRNLKMSLKLDLAWLCYLDDTLTSVITLANFNSVVALML